MKTQLKLRYVLGLLVIVMSISLNAQTTLMVKSSQSALSVSGTSTIHDWEMEVEEMKGNLLVSNMDDLESVQKGELSFNVKSLVSGQSLMNKKAYAALKESKHPVIKGKILKIYSSASQYKVELELTVAGVTKAITSNFKTSIVNTTQIKVQGNFDLKLSDFDIEPPVAIMGTIKTGDAVNVKYSILFEKN
ncbi:YceI family protein [Plebeiibacterium sediminum]|uniref:YceI family protein n=1 Tax=Plebeiibacterium sediminum TaxID=2992112 RepID=A0AAE3M7G0_9BACT|nr:YceI family protein [Plebeiobacterium sediminum]MCW3788322.1 YceI family protein [Plebeiobacterium sediminum]